MMAQNAQQLVVDWNQRYPVGTPVKTKLCSGVITTHTTTPAVMVSREIAAVFVAASMSCVLLDRCQPLGGQHVA